MVRLLITALVLGAVAMAVYWVKQQQASARAQVMAGGPPPATVTATRVQQTAWSERIEALGSLTAIQDVAVASEVPGKVQALAFESGAEVEKGAVLVRLDDSDDRALLTALEAELELARLEYDRVRSLRGSSAVSQSLLDQARAQVASLEARVQRQRVLVERKTILSPFSGVLGIREVSLGTIVAAGDPIVRLQTAAPIYVDFTVPERHRGRLAVGQSLEVEVAAWPGERFEGMVRVVSPAVDERSRSLRLRGTLGNKDRRLQPGMFATVHLQLGAQRSVLTLPRTAISFFAYGESVFALEGEGSPLTARRVPIAVGRTRAGRVEVLDGLAAGQRVVHTGHLKLRDGQAVVVTDPIPLPEGLTDG